MNTSPHFYKANPELTGEDYLLQVLPNGEIYQFYEGIPEWFGPEYFDLADCDEIRYEKAMEIVKTWSEPFWRCHENDLQDFSYQLVTPPTLSVQIIISSGEFTFINNESVSDKPPRAEKSFARKTVRLDKENTRLLLYNLRLCYDTEMPRSELFDIAFGLFAAQKQCDLGNVLRMHGKTPFALLLDFCKEHGIHGSVIQSF